MSERRFPNLPSRSWRMAFYVVLIAALLGVNYWAAHRVTQETRIRVPYSPFFLEQVRAGNVVSGHLDRLRAPGRSSSTRPSRPAPRLPRSSFVTEIPSFADTNQLSQLLQQHGVVVNAKPIDNGSPSVEAALLRLRPDDRPAAAPVLGLPPDERIADGRRAGPLACAPLPAGARDGDVRRRRRHRRGEAGADRDRRLPARPGEVPPTRRTDPPRRPAERAARDRQDAARAGRRRRGGCAVLLDVGLGVRRGDRRRGRLTRARPVPAGEAGVAGDRLHRRARRGRPRPQQRRRRASAAATSASRR